MSKRHKWLGIGLALLVPVIVAASNLMTPNTFSPNTAIKSADMNANFAAVQTAVNSKADATQLSQVGSSRLAMLAMRSADGATLPYTAVGGTAFFDRTTSVNCSPLSATDGTTRCLPTVAGYAYGVFTGSNTYADANCTQLLYAPQIPNPPGLPVQTAYLASLYTALVDAGAAYEAHQMTVYSGTRYEQCLGFPFPDGGTCQSGTCSPSANPPPTAYTLGSVLLPNNFAQFTLTTL